MSRAGRGVALGDGVQEGDEVLAHSGRQLLRQPKVQQDLRACITLPFATGDKCLRVRMDDLSV